MNISDRIQSLRKARGITQEQLADAVGVSRQAVSKWEAEQSVPDLERIVAMAEYFDVTTDYLLRPQPENSETKTEKPPREQRDWVERFLAFAKRKWYLLGWLLIVWGVLDLVQLVLFYLAYRGMISGLTGLIGW